MRYALTQLETESTHLRPTTPLPLGYFAHMWLSVSDDLHPRLSTQESAQCTPPT